MKNLYRFLVLTTLVTCSASASFAADYTVDPTHSSINFTIKHLVSKVNGRFNDFSGTFCLDPKKLADAKADVTIKAASISTENEKRDTHLKSADFFDVEKFPTITFKAKKVTAAGKDKFKLVGDVTMHGVTKEETFDIEFGGAAKDPWVICARVSPPLPSSTARISVLSGTRPSITVVTCLAMTSRSSSNLKAPKLSNQKVAPTFWLRLALFEPGSPLKASRLFY